MFLFLRAIFTHLFNSDNQTDESKHFISMIAPAIWKTNKLTGKIDFKQILLMSKVINNEGNEILRGILETGEATPRSKDNYSINYLRLQELFKEKASSDPLQIYDFIYAILNQAIILPITAEDQEMALTIFSTLCRFQYQVQRYDKSSAKTSFGDLKSKLFLGLLFSSILIFRICLSSTSLNEVPLEMFWILFVPHSVLLGCARSVPLYGYCRVRD